MKAYIDHVEGMEEMELGDIEPSGIMRVADAMSRHGAWIADFNGGCMCYGYAGHRIQPDRDNPNRAEIVFVFGPDER